MPWSTATAIPSCKGSNVHLTLKRREAPSAPPLGELLSECEAEGVRYDICNMPKVTHDTPSVSPFGLPAPPEVEPRALRADTPICRKMLPPVSVSLSRFTIVASSAFSSLTRWHPHGIIHRKRCRNAYLLRLAAIAAGRFFWIFSFLRRLL